MQSKTLKWILVAFALLSFYLASNYYWFADERRYWVIGISYTYLLTQFLNAIFGFEITMNWNDAVQSRITPLPYRVDAHFTRAHTLSAKV